MALTREQKAEQVAELVKHLTASSSVVFSRYIGLNVADVSELRRKLRDEGAVMQVAKKTLIKIAMERAGYPTVTDAVFDGPIACIFSTRDPLSGARVAHNFAKKHPPVELMGGSLDGKALTKAQATELATMRSREELLAVFAMMIRSPLIQFARVCSSPLSGFARAVSLIAERGGMDKTAA